MLKHTPSKSQREQAGERGWPMLEVTTPPLPGFDRTLAFYERSFNPGWVTVNVNDDGDDVNVNDESP